MDKKILNEINRNRELMGIKESLLIIERVTNLMKSIAKAGSGVDRSDIANIFKKIQIKPDDVTDGDIALIRNFLKNSAILDNEVIGHFTLYNNKTDFKEVFIESMAGQLDRLNDIQDLNKYLYNTFGDGRHSVIRWMANNGFDIKDLDVFKSAVRTSQKAIDTSYANKIKIGAMTSEQIRDFLKTHGHEQFGNTSAGRTFRNILEFVAGDWMPSGDEAWRAYKSGALSKIKGDNATEQWKTFEESLKELKKAKSEIKTLELGKKINWQKEYDELVGKTPGYDKLPSTVKAVISTLFGISTTAGVHQFTTYQPPKGENGWTEFNERLKAGWEGFLFLWDLLQLSGEGTQEVKASVTGRYTKFPELDDEEGMKKLKEYIVLYNKNNPNDENISYDNSSGIFDDDKYFVLILADRENLSVGHKTPPDFSEIEKLSITDINRVIE